MGMRLGCGWDWDGDGIGMGMGLGLGWDWDGIGMGLAWDGIGMGFLFPSFSSTFPIQPKHKKSPTIITKYLYILRGEERVQLEINRLFKTRVSSL